MTATLCGLLVEEGKIAWDARLADSLPELAKAMDPGWKECTLEMLLQHRGGAASDLSPEGLRDRLWQFRGPPEEGRVLLAKGLFGRPPLSPPGAKFLYANASYALAGAMAERATNKPVEALLRERVFGPLGMRSAAFGAPGAADRLDQPRGHTEAGVPVEPGPAADNPAPMAPAGGVHATLEDWARFVGLHARGEKRPSLLKAETFRRLHAPASSIGSTYAMGWDVTKRGWGGGDGRVLVHTGSNTMWFCVAWIAPEREFGVLAVCNQGGDAGAKACDEAAWALIQDHLAHEGAAAAK